MKHGRRHTIVLLVLAAVLGGPAGAHATLVYNRDLGTNKPALYVAGNDGSSPVKLATGFLNPHISPDGSQVIAQKSTTSSRTPLYVIPVAGGAPRKLLSNVIYGSYVWAPDSVHVAATTGKRLAWIEATAGYVTTLTTITGVFNTPPSVSPGSDAVAYSVLPKPTARLPRSNVFSVPVAGGQPAQLTNDNTSSAPVWGPAGIAFSRGPFGKFGQPKLNIWLMGADGSNQRQLTHGRANSFLSGLSPLQWSASGGALLAGFFGEDTDQGYAVDPVSGAARDIGAKKFDGTSGYAISRDGSTVLATTGGSEGPGPDIAVVAIPFAGGPPTVLVRGGFLPDWNA